MRNAALFSVVLPTRDRAHVLPRSIASVLAQEFGDLELIVVDDGSKDATREAVDAFGDARILYHYQTARGAADARNAGARAARGRFLTFLDSDDVALPTWLQRYERVFSSTGAMIVSCGNFIVQRGSGDRTVRLPDDMGPAFDHVHGRFTHAGTFALERAAFLQIGGYASDLPASQHTELACRLLPAAAANGWRIDAIGEPLIEYHRGSAGSIRADDRAVLEGSKYILEHHRDLLQRDPRLLANYCGVVGVRAARLGEGREARRYLGRSVGADPGRLRSWLRLAVAAVPPLSRRVWPPTSRPILTST